MTSLDVKRSLETRSMDLAVGEGFWTPALCDGGARRPGRGPKASQAGRALFGGRDLWGFAGRSADLRAESASAPRLPRANLSRR
jgi:hypothetical protein